MIGKTISRYKILEKIGEGGMGVVYKAEDTKLGRLVAIKFLPGHIAANEENRKRFEIEAKAAAALNHPNLATIHTVEDVDGESFIVMEYIEGQELKEIVGACGASPLAFETILDYAAQIAEGLQVAHEKTVIHRDIKSANIMFTEKAQVKIMDFGLAKVRGATQLTKEHSTLGTVSYISPEQALGEDTDHRTDIWAFGVVLFEMITGQLPFPGDRDSVILNAILNNEPASIADKRENVPSEIQKITYKCLQKNRKHRYQAFEDILFDLAKAGIAPDSGKSKPKTRKHWQKTQGTTTVIGIVAVICLIVLPAFFIISNFFGKSKAPQIVNTRSINYPTTETAAFHHISPDGTRLAYASDKSGNLDMWVQQLASGQRLNLTESYKGEDSSGSWSPDGQWLAFKSTRDGGGIFVVSAYGGAVRLVQAHPYEDIGGVWWLPDGKNLSFSLKGKIYLVPAHGGKPEEINLPHLVGVGLTWSPDAKRIAYSTHDKIWVVGLDGKHPTVVVDNGYFPHWSSDGKRIYFKRHSGEIRDVWWIKVDELGRPKDKARRLTSGRNIILFSFSNNEKKMVYETGSDVHNIHSLPITKNTILSLGNTQQITYEKWDIHERVNTLSMSPELERICFTAAHRFHYQIQIVNKNGNNLRSVTSDSVHKFAPRWTPDGENIVFWEGGDIYSMSIKGGPATPIVSHPAHDIYPACSPDGKQVTFVSNRGGNTDLWVIPYNGGVAKQLTNDAAKEYEPLWSPAGDIISFCSDNSGVHDIYLFIIASGTIKKITSIKSPDFIGHAWSPDGKKIYISYRPKPGENSRNICEVAVEDKSIRTLLEAKNLAWQNRLQRAITADENNIYFVKELYDGNNWVADVVYE